ncbi:hypothetical protein DB41_BW00020 [Neochlamydia sp. TUME1]|nr:hypothetical protein DB41_BW00020 [Neochlamydia sp. TUME1]
MIWVLIQADYRDRLIQSLRLFKNVLKVSEAKVAQEEMILTENQLKALEKPRKKKKCMEKLKLNIQVIYYLKDTYYVGTIKGVGRIY